MSGAVTESELLTSAQQGDQAALGRLLLLHERRLRQHISARLPRTAVPQVGVCDILQQAYTAAFRDFSQFEFRGDGSFFAWLKRITERQLGATLRALSRKKRGGDLRQVTAARDTDSSALQLLDILEGETPTASSVLRRNEAVEALFVALASLPADYEQVIRRRFLQGETLEETARAMNRSTASIRAIASRAKKVLRDLMGRLSM